MPGQGVLRHSGDPAAALGCRSCGAPVRGRPFIGGGEDVCCEDCHLKRLQQLATGAAAHAEVAEALAAALDARERETGLHSKRVACHTLVLARRFSGDREALNQAYWGSLLHDVGKIGIPDAILLKPTSLTDEEWRVMRTHPKIGHRILAGIPFLREATEVVLTHEERYDGSGYPAGLSGEAIPLWARLFAVIDTLDAMTSDRPYRRAASFEAAKGEILRMSSIQFDPLAVQAFLAEEATLRQMVESKCAVHAYPSGGI